MIFFLVVCALFICVTMHTWKQTQSKRGV